MRPVEEVARELLGVVDECDCSETATARIADALRAREREVLAHLLDRFVRNEEQARKLGHSNLAQDWQVAAAYTRALLNDRGGEG